MAYATFDDVLARAGRVGGAFTVAGKRPNQADITAFIATVSAEIDLEIRRAGYDPSTLDATETAALTDLAAWGAVARGLAGIDPSSRPDNLQQLIDQAERIWPSEPGARRAAIVDDIIGVLLAGPAGPAESRAGSWWDDGAAVPAARADLEATGVLLPFRRGMSL